MSSLPTTSDDNHDAAPASTLLERCEALWPERTWVLEGGSPKSHCDGWALYVRETHVYLSTTFGHPLWSMGVSVSTNWFPEDGDADCVAAAVGLWERRDALVGERLQAALDTVRAS